MVKIAAKIKLAFLKINILSGTRQTVSFLRPWAKKYCQCKAANKKIKELEVICNG